MRKPILFSTLVLLSLGASHAAPHKTKLTLADAKTIALAREPGSVKSGELEHEKGRWIYSFDIVKGNDTREVNVDADSGSIVEDSLDTPAEEAREAAEDKKSKSH